MAASVTFLYGEADQSSFTPKVVEMMIKGAQMMNLNAFALWKVSRRVATASWSVIQNGRRKP
ncbi:predicted protein [Botrytis cinerea T4]|uniref:Uncharacterized protein n=1 Tax=Botryotinia fuckeliana (strain T4) TaxID=999810 RepID=G2YGU6_BOTF4|nr:predicted protein [Botrytis cinerea T4]